MNLKILKKATENKGFKFWIIHLFFIYSIIVILHYKAEAQENTTTYDSTKINNNSLYFIIIEKASLLVALV